MSGKTRKKKQQPDHMSWIEINAILGTLAAQAASVFHYLPPEHPESFCQSLAIAGQALERLANDAARFAGSAPQGADCGHGR